MKLENLAVVAQTETETKYAATLCRDLKVCFPKVLAPRLCCSHFRATHSGCTDCRAIHEGLNTLDTWTLWP